MKVETSPEVLQKVLKYAWQQIKSSAGEPRSAKITYPSYSFEGDVYVVPQLDTGFHLWTAPEGNRNGIWVFSDVQEREVLTADFEFNLPTRSGTQTWGRVVIDGDDLILAHVGRLGGGRRSIKGEVFRQQAGLRGVFPTKIGRDDLFLISHLSQGTVVKDLTGYARLCHAIRYEVPPDEVPSGGRIGNGSFAHAGFNPGYEGEFERSVKVAAEAHYAITRALKSSCERLGWRVAETGNVLPDLLVENDRRRVLFEVKPGINSSSLLMAIGQLLVYNKAIGADTAVLVAPGIDDDWSSPLYRLIREVMDSHSISRLECVRDGEKWTFPRLRAVLGADS